MPGNWRKVGVRCIAALVLSGLAFSLQDWPPTTDQKNIYKVAGTVINSITGRPIPRVLVMLPSSPQRAMLTGSVGEFSFDAVPQGIIDLTVKKPGFFRPGRKPTENLPVRVRVGPDAQNLVITLEPEAMITGTVSGKGEEPLEGALVDVLSYQIIEGRKQLTGINRAAVTDEDGNFRITGLASGRYYVSVKARGSSQSILGTPAGSGDETYPPLTYFPSADDISSATPIDLAAGQSMEVRFMLKPVPSFKVAGVITSATGKRLNIPAIVDEFGQMLFQPQTFDIQSGAFEFRAVPAGNYWLQFGVVDPEGRSSSSYRKITVQANVSDLRLAVPAEIEIPVVVRAEFNRPERRSECRYYAANGEVQTSDCSDYPQVQLELASLSFRNTTIFSEMGPQKSGLRIRGITPGQYSVRVTPTLGGYVQSARCGAQDLLREPFLVPESGGIPPIEVVLRDDTGRLTIQLHAEKPAQQRFIVLFRDSINTRPEIQATIEGDEFETGPLPPGAYRILAFDTPDGVSYADPDTLSRYSSKAATVTVAANAHGTVAVEVIHAGE